MPHVKREKSDDPEFLRGLTVRHATCQERQGWWSTVS